MGLVTAGLPCKQAHLWEFMEKFTGANWRRIGRGNIFSRTGTSKTPISCVISSIVWALRHVILLYSNNNNNDNDNNGNFIYVFECTIVNLVTHRQFTNAAWDWIIKKKKNRNKKRKKKEKKRNPNCIKSGLSQTIQVRLVISALLTMANFRCTVTLRDCLVTLSILFSVFPFRWFYVENNFLGSFRRNYSAKIWYLSRKLRSNTLVS